MNHVPAPPSSPAVAGSSTHRHQASPRLRRDDSHESAASSSASAIAEESGSPSVDEDDPAFSPASAPSAPTRQQIQAGRQYELLLSILRDLDALVWVHLCVGYYME